MASRTTSKTEAPAVAEARTRNRVDPKGIRLTAVAEEAPVRRTRDTTAPYREFIDPSVVKFLSSGDRVTVGTTIKAGQEGYLRTKFAQVSREDHRPFSLRITFLYPGEVETARRGLVLADDEVRMLITVCPQRKSAAQREAEEAATKVKATA